jgi:uncharacterized membrane protein
VRAHSVKADAVVLVAVLCLALLLVLLGILVGSANGSDFKEVSPELRKGQSLP